MPQRTIPLSSPDISEADIAAVTAVLRTPRLSLGPRVPEFEEAVAAFVGAKYAIAVNSGTSALHLCVRALGIADGDEVITTPFSFVASANCMLFERAVPRFVDILPETYCMDPAKVEAAITTKTKAILGVDVFGYVENWSVLRAIAKKHNLALIEDSCEALGSSSGGKKAGTFGDCGTFAFYPNKQMTTGEGGMIVTDRDDIARAARMMRNQGRDPDAAWLDHQVLGYNYRLSDIHAALGVSQLKRLPEFMANRARVAGWYGKALAPLSEHLRVPEEQKGVDVSWFVYVVRLADRYTAADRDRLLTLLREWGIGCNTYFPCIHLQPFYQKLYGHTKGEFPVAESVSDHALALPFFNALTEDDVAQVASMLKESLAILAS
ncbi:MAG: DegT/DnrJ/EryC1/StrS family aminotransferase [Candidatus Peribacteraceae bacterium]|nr:DegT/DnrJ/EryC1/StrS family aminotransferase [Candidatus Peribacteraceae bacterium]